MRKNKTYHRLKAFTIVEMLITLALMSVVITMSYTTLTYMQKLFSSYKMQNKFINQYTDLKKRMDYESVKAAMVTEESEHNFLIHRDSIITLLQINDKAILLKRGEQCDTFNIIAKNIKVEYEPINNPAWNNKLIRSLQFETEFIKQKFNFTFTKNYEAALKLALNQTQ
jgi:prepilin-type N-terminal cleavage/methylation domain-containing protein